MSQVLKQNPRLGLKLSSSSMNISVAVAKLKAYQKEIKEEKAKDKLFHQQIVQGFQGNAEIDSYYAELFNDVSTESDSLAKGGLNKDVE